MSDYTVTINDIVGTATKVNAEWDTVTALYVRQLSDATKNYLIIGETNGMIAIQDWVVSESAYPVDIRLSETFNSAPVTITIKVNNTTVIVFQDCYSSFNVKDISLIKKDGRLKFGGTLNFQIIKTNA